MLGHLLRAHRGLSVFWSRLLKSIICQTALWCNISLYVSAAHSWWWWCWLLLSSLTRLSSFLHPYSCLFGAMLLQRVCVFELSVASLCCRVWKITKDFARHRNLWYVSVSLLNTKYSRGVSRQFTPRLVWTWSLSHNSDCVGLRSDA